LIRSGKPSGDVFEDVRVLAFGIVEAGCINEPNVLAIKLEVGDSDILSA
jgi:hypothetical protein